jgi:hypothetical protein
MVGQVFMLRLWYVPDGLARLQLQTIVNIFQDATEKLASCKFSNVDEYLAFLHAQVFEQLDTTSVAGKALEFVRVMGETLNRRKLLPQKLSGYEVENFCFIICTHQ